MYTNSLIGHNRNAMFLGYPYIGNTNIIGISMRRHHHVGIKVSITISILPPSIQVIVLPVVSKDAMSSVEEGKNLVFTEHAHELIDIPSPSVGVGWMQMIGKGFHYGHDHIAESISGGASFGANGIGFGIDITVINLNPPALQII